VELYVELLADIPGYVLGKAVEAHISSSIWFPKVAELRQAAAEVAVTTDFSGLPQTLADNLRGEAVLLDNLFFRQGILEPAEWGKLAAAFDAAGRGYGVGGRRVAAKHLRSRTTTQENSWSAVWSLRPHLIVSAANVHGVIQTYNKGKWQRGRERMTCVIY
jgi:hypothetical protein